MYTVMQFVRFFKTVLPKHYGWRNQFGGLQPEFKNTE